MKTLRFSILALTALVLALVAERVNRWANELPPPMAAEEIGYR